MQSLRHYCVQVITSRERSELQVGAGRKRCAATHVPFGVLAPVARAPGCQVGRESKALSRACDGLVRLAGPPIARPKLSCGRVATASGAGWPRMRRYPRPDCAYGSGGSRVQIGSLRQFSVLHVGRSEARCLTRVRKEFWIHVCECAGSVFGSQMSVIPSQNALKHVDVVCPSTR